MKTETWNGHQIRFVEKGGEWWAVAKDAADALGFRDANAATRKMKAKYKGTHKVRTPSGEQEMIVLNELGLYRLVMRSNKPEAEDFQDWVCEMLKELRRQSGLEGFQVFRMLDKEHQKEALKRLSVDIQPKRPPVRRDFIKAHTLANKAVSNRHGYEKMVKKEAMSPMMLVERQEVLDDTVNLMALNEKYSIGLSVSQQIYKSCKS